MSLGASDVLKPFQKPGIEAFASAIRQFLKAHLGRAVSGKCCGWRAAAWAEGVPDVREVVVFKASKSDIAHAADAVKLRALRDPRSVELRLGCALPVFTLVSFVSFVERNIEGFS